MVVLARVFEFKTLRQVVVHLDSTQLPTATDSVFDHKVQFRAIESRLAIFYFCGQTFLAASLDDSTLGFLPNLVATHILGGVLRVAQRDLCLEVLEIQCFEDNLDNLHYADKLVLYLVRAAEDMRIVLCDRAHTRQSVQLARLLIAIDGTELCTAERQVFVTAGAVLVDSTVVGAVHRLEQINFALLRSGDRLERILAVVVPVSGGYV